MGESVKTLFPQSTGHRSHNKIASNVNIVARYAGLLKQQTLPKYLMRMQQVGTRECLLTLHICSMDSLAISILYVGCELHRGGVCPQPRSIYLTTPADNKYSSQTAITESRQRQMSNSRRVDYRVIVKSLWSCVIRVLIGFLVIHWMEVISWVQDYVRHQFYVFTVNIPRLVGYVDDILFVKQAAGRHAKDAKGRNHNGNSYNPYPYVKCINSIKEVFP